MNYRLNRWLKKDKVIKYHSWFYCWEFEHSQQFHTEIKDQDSRDSSSNQVVAVLPLTNEVRAKETHFLIRAIKKRSPGEALQQYVQY